MNELYKVCEYCQNFDLEGKLGLLEENDCIICIGNSFNKFSGISKESMKVNYKIEPMAFIDYTKTEPEQKSLKETMFDTMDIEDGDNVYFIRERDTGGKSTIQRLNYGFNAFELIGLLESTKIDVQNNSMKGIKPTEIIRQIIVDKVVEK